MFPLYFKIITACKSQLQKIDEFKHKIFLVILRTFFFLGLFMEQLKRAFSKKEKKLVNK